MNQYIEKLNAELAESPYAIDSVLELLWQYYLDGNPYRDDAIRQREAELSEVFAELSVPSADILGNLICNVCTAYQHAAFIEGICIGTRLQAELRGA